MESEHVEGSYPNTAPMHIILQDALDDLASTRTSTATKGDALVAIEHVLAETSDPRAVGLPEYFNALQDTFQCNVSSRIVSWTSVASALLDKALTRGSTNNVTKCEVMTLASQLTQGMGIIQGVALVHKPSKQFLGRRCSLEVLLDLLLVSRHLTPPTASSTPASPKTDSASASPPKAYDVPLASVILDTLLCILVDSSPALRVFEDLHGVQVVVKILKRAGTPREVRMKCLEFLYFYLLDETVPPESSFDTAVSNLPIPDTPPTRPTHRSASSLSVVSGSGFTTTPSSRSSSGSSGFSVLSTSTTGTSASLHETPIRLKSQTSTETPEKSPLRRKSVIPGLTPSTRNVTPPSVRPATEPSALGRGQPRSKLLILKKEVDYVPLSPKKPQLSHLSRGPSGLRPKHPDQRGSLTQLRPSGASADAGDSRQNGASTPRTRPSTPLTSHMHSHSHSRGLSVSSISSISSIESASLRTPPPNPSPGPGPGPGPTSGPGSAAGPRRERLRGAHTEILETPKPASASAKAQMHRRAQSLADFSSPSPTVAVPGVAESPGPLAASRSASAPTGARGANRGAKTMAEKKEILGTMLGNVDALVEGVKKAGVWGLS